MKKDEAFLDLQVYCYFLLLLKAYTTFQEVDKHIERIQFPQMCVVYLLVNKINLLKTS